MSWIVHTVHRVSNHFDNNVCLTGFRVLGHALDNAFWIVGKRSDQYLRRYTQLMYVSHKKNYVTDIFGVMGYKSDPKHYND